MILRKALPSDLDDVVRILEMGRASLAAQGLDQWQGGAPFDKIASHDIETGNQLVVTNDEGAILGVVAYVTEGEADYSYVTAGHWLTKSPNCPEQGVVTYPVLHRVAVDASVTRQGVATFLLKQCFELAREDGFKSVRVDTHEGNLRMQRAFLKCGMVRCCEIEITNPFEPTKKRIGFEITL